MSAERDPDAAIARARRDEREQSGRGALRIYLGAFAGVGKTYAMLNEAQRRVSYGEDVVVGFVETHGRRQTEMMLAGLEVVPRKRIEYRGVAVEEMGVEAILRRRPAVCLVDELAHTNAPGSEREKRYEDVQLLLEGGIDVVSTLNVQHLEGLNDVVERITGVRVRETLPDSVIDEADEVILIDISPEAARARMEHGNIYPPQQARTALAGFFRPENLAALREMALRRTAQEVDEQLDTYMREIARRKTDVDEHVLVLIDERPFSRTLVRRGWRIAQGMHADLLVTYARRELGEAAQREFARTLELAEDLNARVIPYEGAESADRLATLIAAEGVNHVVLPHRRRGVLQRLASRSLADQLMLSVPDLDVHLVGERERA
ncbi:MAG TPA: sensor histidine kinase KdpD [Dehalococcoidia bacterium]|nr:sensor histidine kinase KdpD [Dehalococcoidia bacterium]